MTVPWLRLYHPQRPRIDSQGRPRLDEANARLKLYPSGRSFLIGLIGLGPGWKAGEE